jgi:hypothetical protein
MPTATPRAAREPADSRTALSSLCREIGLAAVAIELNLEVDRLRPDVAEAIRRGSAALLDRGYGSSLIPRQLSVRVGEKGSRRKMRSGANKTRQPDRLSTRKGDVELRL